MGQSPKSPPQRRNFSTLFNLRSKYVLLSCGYIAKKKNGEKYLNEKLRELPMQGSSLMFYIEENSSVLSLSK